MEEWITTDSRNTPSTTNPKDEEIVDAPGKDGNASMPEQVKRPNSWRKVMMMMKLGDGILIASSIVPSIEKTDFALFSVSFSPSD